MKSLIIILSLLFSAQSFANLTEPFSIGHVIGVEKMKDTDLTGVYLIKYSSCATFPSISHTVRVVNQQDILVQLNANHGHCVDPENSQVGVAQIFLGDLFEEAGSEPNIDSKIFFSLD